MLAAGSQAPDFVLPTLSGETASLHHLTGSEPALLAFLKVSCPVCQYTFPFLERLSAAQGLRILGISQDGAGPTAEFCQEFGVSFPMALDPPNGNYAASDAYRITHVPSLFLVEGAAITQAVSGFSRKDLTQLGERFGVALFHKGEKIAEFRPG
jgi:peroxiredoxin